MRLLVAARQSELVERAVVALQAEGMSARVSSDAMTAREMALAESFDLLILDPVLFDAFSDQMVHAIRSAKPGLAILVIGLGDSLVEKIKQIEAGADDYLKKPFEIAELVARAKSLLRRGNVPRTNVLRVGDLELDRLTLTVRREGRRVELTAKEYALLEYLMVNAGRALSRAMIIEHVWDRNISKVGNVVDVVVRSLRTKIDGAREPKLLVTLRGVGYGIVDGA